MAAPVCTIAPPPPTFDSSAPQLPSIPIVSINPQAWNVPQSVIKDLQLLAEAINTIRQVVNAMGNRGAAPNNTGGGPLIGGVGGQGIGLSLKKPPSNQQQRQQRKQGAGFKEVNRVVKKVKVVNPDDKEQYVIINQIVSLTLRDPVSGLTWTWTQGADLNENSP